MEPTAAGQTRPPEISDGLPVPRRYWSVLTIWLAMSMSVLDGAIANVALPTIARELNASPASSIWIVNAYQLAITVCLLPFAALGDKLGYRRVYMAGLAVFTAGSLGCALSHTLSALTAARILQGLGAAGIMSINAALVRFTYPHRLLGRGIGLNAVVISISAAVGPTVASAILARASWEWLFAINVPIGVVAILVAIPSLPRTMGSGKPFDWISAILNALSFGLLITGVESLAREGLQAGLLKLAGGVVAGAALARRELGRAAPLVPFDLLRIPIFGLSIATSVVSFAAQMLAYVALPFYFQTVMGHSAVATGLLMTPWPLAVAWRRPSPAGSPTAIRRARWAAQGWPCSPRASRSWRWSARAPPTSRSAGAWRSAAWASASSSRPTIAPCWPQPPCNGAAPPAGCWPPRACWARRPGRSPPPSSSTSPDLAPRWWR